MNRILQADVILTLTAEQAARLVEVLRWPDHVGMTDELRETLEEQFGKHGLLL
ncbi:hypothetical protein KK141_09270 [Dyella sp. LX-66]|uniref:hypothetical protein n=1 Tax=unclassified Dyella TaxID=2634549 RepID=UPI001BE11B35|nr:MULTISPECIES: hypothetical protein [unclassified Dyella]MBT2117201.1 hypothetical protein [Dyella sp. LX-1]MBT2139723.1 hypothetical protein [Dyella sp. LX-66]